MAKKTNRKSATLTRSQEAFSQEYVRNGRNATQAYRKAFPGSAKSADAVIWANASRLLAQEKVAIRVSALAEKIAAVVERKFEVTTERVLAELAAIAFGDPREVHQWGTTTRPVFTKKGLPVIGEDGKQLTEAVPFLNFTSSDKLSADAISTVVGAEMTITRQGDAVLNVKRADKVAALKLLGTHLKLFTNKVEHTGKDGTPLQIVISSADANL